MENTKKNKGIIIAIIVAIIVLAVAAAVFIFVKLSDNKKEDTNQKATSYHQKRIEEFGKACESEENMEKFVKENVNLRAFYAMENSAQVEDFEEEYKNAKPEDYEDEEFVETVVSTFKDYAESGATISIKNVGELKDVTEDEGMIGKLLSSIDGIKSSKFTIESDGVQISAYAYFYDEKILIIMPDFAGIGSDFEEND